MTTWCSGLVMNLKSTTQASSKALLARRGGPQVTAVILTPVPLLSCPDVTSFKLRLLKDTGIEAWSPAKKTHTSKQLAIPWLFSNHGWNVWTAVTESFVTPRLQRVTMPYQAASLPAKHNALNSKLFWWPKGSSIRKPSEVRICSWFFPHRFWKNKWKTS